MALLGEKDASDLRRFLAARLRGPVTVEFFTATPSKPSVRGGGGETCGDTGRLLAEIAGLSARIRLEVHDFFAEADAAATAGVDRIPAIVLKGGARGRVRYFGIPSGYELGTLLEQIIDVGNGATDLAERTKQAVRGLAKAVHIRVFVTPACPFCPAAARLAQKMAVESDKVTADVIAAGEFPDLVERYGIRLVPKVLVNETVAFTGAQAEAHFLDSVLRAAT
jgi:glutaredoxin-like protein